MSLRRGRFGPLCGWYRHLHKCLRVAALKHCRYFIFHDDYTIWVRKNQVFFHDLNLDFTTSLFGFLHKFYQDRF